MRGKDASLGHFVDHQINEPKWEAWKVLPEAVRTGQVAFALAHDGMDMHQVRCVSVCPNCLVPCPSLHHFDAFSESHMRAAHRLSSYSSCTCLYHLGHCITADITACSMTR